MNMKKSTFIIGLILAISLLFNFSIMGNPVKEKAKSSDITNFMGQWSFNIGTRKGLPGTVGWLEVKHEGAFWEANILWGGGSVVPVPYLYFADNTLYIGRDSRRVVLQKNEEGNPVKTQNIPAWVELKVSGNEITGYHLTPRSDYVGLDTVVITGKKMPDMPSAPNIKNLKFDKPINLIKDTKSLKGWKLVEENAKNGWSMKDGVLSNNPAQKEGEPHIRYGNLRTEQEFEDFNLKLELQVKDRSNSGIYLRGMMEVQVSDSYGKPVDIHNTMGAVYSRITPTVNASKPAGEWQKMDITYVDRHITVKLNGITIIDNKPVYGPTGGAIYSDILSPGPIYLQGDHTEAIYRNIILTPIIN